MRFVALLSRLLTVLAIVGMVMGAATAPVGAGSGDMPPMAMAGDMPDCTEKAGDCGDTKSCPYMVVCAAKLSQNLPAMAPVEVPLALALSIAPHNDRVGESRAIPPLPRPPEA